MFVFLLFLFMLFQPFPAHASTGRIKIDASPASAPAGSTSKINVKLLQGEESGAQPSTGEKAEIKIRDAKDGQSCTTDPSPSDSTGTVNGTCTATTPGTMTIYAESKDRGDSSEDSKITFTDKPTPSPSGNPKITGLPGQQTQQGTDPSASSIVNQAGLAEDKNNGQVAGIAGGGDNGLQPADATTPAPAQQIPDTSRSDIDLINSLIYLTGGIILLIAGIYFIYLQTKQMNIKKKEKDTNTPMTDPSIKK